MKFWEQIETSFGLGKPEINRIINDSRRCVKHIKIPKHNGGFRLVVQPTRKVKLIQYWLIDNVFSKMEVHSSAMSYRPNISIRRNAEVHKNMRYFLKLDFIDFFWSLNYSDFVVVFDSFLGRKKILWSDNKFDRNLMRCCCFYKDDALPIGYPSSPIISNIIMYNLDVAIKNKLEVLEEKIGGKIVYTRYADDLVFSTNIPGACEEIKNSIISLVSGCNSPKLKFNYNKLKMTSSSGGSAVVTGLRICHDGHITLRREYKDQVRFFLNLMAKDGLKKEDIFVLRGHLAYVQDVDPVFYTKLQEKYFKQIEGVEK
ncbi:MAG: retron St85 family RNA-directed DNA polymerase [Deltaproteobacteria bacterium]|nr:retron St85 family RNA-directed DNA polymerase [Deltaproteobacteria bacterium]